MNYHKVIIESILYDGNFGYSKKLIQKMKLTPMNISYDNINLPQASLLAKVPPINRLELVKNIYNLFGTQNVNAYLQLLQKKIETPNPQKLHEFHHKNIPITEQLLTSITERLSVFDMFFPYHTIDVGYDVFAFLPSISPTNIFLEYISSIDSSLTKTGRYSPEEIKAFTDFLRNGKSA
ncbi:hypothetical protein [Salinispira pacifica]|uniref:hypothetical protein n=1 Tax=Salinispira pacifica TaxID=1307761 RepID=UPI00059E5ACF|nr:hypothetical protein [Salinispira pacifica]